MSNATLEHNMDNVFTDWTISEEVRKDFERYQPNNAEAEDNKRRTPSTTQEPGASKHVLTERKSVSQRTFNRPGGNSENAAFTPIDRMSPWDFFSFFNALGDRVMPKLTLPGQAIFFALFRKAHGFNRNWCQMSLPQLERKTGASRNTIRKHLKILIENGLVCILSDGYHEATTYGLCIPVTIKETWAEDDEETPLPAGDQQAGVEPVEIPGPTSAYVELDTPVSPDREEQNSTLSADKQLRADDTCQQATHRQAVSADKQAAHKQEQTVRRSKFDRMYWYMYKTKSRYKT